MSVLMIWSDLHGLSDVTDLSAICLIPSADDTENISLLRRKFAALHGAANFDPSSLAGPPHLTIAYLGPLLFGTVRLCPSSLLNRIKKIVDKSNDLSIGTTALNYHDPGWYFLDLLNVPVLEAMRDQILFYFNKNVVLPRKSHHDPLITGQILTALDADEQILQRYLPHITLMRTKSRKVITNIDSQRRDSNHLVPPRVSFDKISVVTLGENGSIADTVLSINLI